MSTISKKDFDTSVRPQDDFYRFVNGGWFKRNTIPPTENRWGSFITLRHQNIKILRALLGNLTKRKNLKKGSDYQKLQTLYASSMNMRKRNRQGLTYLMETFDHIEHIKQREDMTSVLAFLHMRGTDAPWMLWIDQDDKNSKRMVLRISQGGLGVPNRDYYIQKDKESKRILDAYTTYMHRMLRLEGRYTKKEIPRVVKNIQKIERRLAKASMTNVEQRDTHKKYNKRTVAILQKTYPLISWGAYFDTLDVSKRAQKHIIVDQPIFLKEVNTLLEEIPLAHWKMYLRWHFLDEYAGTLGEDFAALRFTYYGRAIQGLTKVPELWKRSVGIADSLMPDALGRLYVERYFPESSKKKITQLVQNLIKAYRMRLKELDWMSTSTKKKALRKLDTVSLQLGYPNKWQSYKKLVIDDESYTQNVMRGCIFHFGLEMQKLAKPTNPNDWFISAPTVNAYYSPNLNQIIFPAGILQSPFFNPKADDAVNYGAIGAVIGHELTHGFDDDGSHFDEQGNLKNWWTKEDRKRFEKRTKVLEHQFNKYKVVDGIYVNGKLTLGENIADLGGVVIAHKAFLLSQKGKRTKSRDGFTPIQRFFISHALTERELIRDEFLKFITLNDTHSPSEFRSNGPMSNVDAFYEAFGVSKGDALYRSPQTRARIW